MAVKSNVRAKRLTATGATSLGRSRLAAINVVTSGGAGRVTITNGLGGATLLDLDTASGTVQYFLFPESGILSDNDPYISTLTNVTSVTLLVQ
jgi:hypothetical protein